MIHVDERYNADSDNPNDNYLNLFMRFDLGVILNLCLFPTKRKGKTVELLI